MEMAQFQDQYDVKKNRWLVPCFLLVDSVALLCIVGLIYFVGFSDYFEPTSRGFFCNDMSIRLPLPADDEIVPDYTLYTSTLLIPIVIVVIGETCVALKRNSKLQLSLYIQKNIRSCNINLSTVIRRVMRFTGASLVGGLTTWLVTVSLQLVAGQHTPYFLAACLPDFSRLDCSEFVESFNCTSMDTDTIRKAKMSFPSIHASLSAYSSLFLLIYLTVVGRIRGTRLLTPIVCCAFMSIAVLICASRVSLFRNHWSDVIAGYILGASISGYMCVIVLQCFLDNPDELQYPNEDVISFPIMRLPRATVTPTLPVAPTIPSIDYTIA